MWKILTIITWLCKVSGEQEIQEDMLNPTELLDVFVQYPLSFSSSNPSIFHYNNEILTSDSENLIDTTDNDNMRDARDLVNKNDNNNISTFPSTGLLLDESSTEIISDDTTNTSIAYVEGNSTHNTINNDDGVVKNKYPKNVIKNNFEYSTIFPKVSKLDKTKMDSIVKKINKTKNNEMIEGQTENNIMKEMTTITTNKSIVMQEITTDDNLKNNETVHENSTLGEIRNMSVSSTITMTEDGFFTTFHIVLILGIIFAVISTLSVVVMLSIVLYRRYQWNKPRTFSDKCSNADSTGYIDDTTLKDNSEEMYSLDNDSFLNSLEAMTIQNYWVDSFRHTKL